MSQHELYIEDKAPKGWSSGLSITKHYRNGKKKTRFVSSEASSYFNMIKRACNGYNYDHRELYNTVYACKRWVEGEKGKTGFQCFIEDMGPKPDSTYTLDRLGDHYVPGECIWSNKNTQARRTGPRKNNTSGYKGVSKAGNKWKVTIWVNNRSLTVGRYTNKKQAALEYNKAAIRYHGKDTVLNKV